jgi:hypothetical protein
MSLDTQSMSGRPRLARRSLVATPPLPQPPRMSGTRSNSLGELALTATLLSIYLSARGTVRALGVLRR